MIIMTDSSIQISDQHDENANSLADQASSHPVATGIGVASGGLAGAAIGRLVGGKLGAAFGAVLGGLAGAALGKEAAEGVDHTVEGVVDALKDTVEDIKPSVKGAIDAVKDSVDVVLHSV